MTAMTSERPVAVPTFGRFTGLPTLFRKDVREWRRGRRAAVVFAISASVMVLMAANAWITARIIEAMPAEAEGSIPLSQAPTDNLFVAVSAGLFVLVAIFAVASLIARERDSGTLAWVASMPVSRTSIWLSKWLSAGVVLVTAAVLLPIGVTTLAVTAMYGLPDLAAVTWVTIGAAFVVVFYAAVGLAAGTMVRSQPAVAAVGFGVFALGPIVAAITPTALAPLLPSSMLGWAVGAATGADVGWVTPVAVVVWTLGLAALAIVRIRRLEL
jgi:ABC-type transport system involved in multi-copper enzyme maturation permease subunit